MKAFKSPAYEFIKNFVVGGIMVSVALLVADMFSPVVGGVIAGLPIRFATTWALGTKRKGHEFGIRMADGSLVGVIGTISFSSSIYFLLFFMDFLTAFSLSIAISIAFVAAARLISRG